MAIVRVLYALIHSDYVPPLRSGGDWETGLELGLTSPATLAIGPDVGGPGFSLQSAVTAGRAPNLAAVYGRLHVDPQPPHAVLVDLGTVDLLVSGDIAGLKGGELVSLEGHLSANPYLWEASLLRSHPRSWRRWRVGQMWLESMTDVTRVTSLLPNEIQRTVGAVGLSDDLTQVWVELLEHPNPFGYLTYEGAGG